MVAFSSIKDGDILWDCHKTRQGNTNISKMGSWPVKILEIYAANRAVKVSWNYNSPKMYGERDIKRLRRTPYAEKASAISSTQSGGEAK